MVNSMQIRRSYGTAVKMGLRGGKMFAEPTTAYIMLGEHCYSNCSFCAQARSRAKKGYLSRVLWLPYPIEILAKLRGFARVCFQTLDYPTVVEDLLFLVPLIPEDVPISVSIVPIPIEEMQLLAPKVDTISFALDAANPEIFDKVKGKGVGNRFTWEMVWNALKEALNLFPNVNTHIIVGLGESDEDLYRVMKKLRDLNISVALFSYTPIFGGEYPDVGRYRAIQLMHHLLYRNHDDFIILESGKIAEIQIPEKERKNVFRGIPFLTSGCPGCNRPFYNERPGGTIYNYPRIPEPAHIKNIINELEGYAHIMWK